ncbi:MAG: tRNA nucleotidyltransferase/poly(A) polymerase family protein [Anaerolineae bacterium]
MNTTPLGTWLERDALFTQAVAWLQKQPAEVWIVGGTVRDALLGRPSDDLDLAVSRGALAMGRSLAAALGGAFYPLDSARDVGRVLVGKTGRHIDLAGLRAGDITADLCSRDFTVNALAAPIRRLDVLLDPTDGLDDLQRRTLRATNPRTFEDDPLRILRAVRLRDSLGFTLDEHTVELLKATLPRLTQVAMERMRDELLLILVQKKGADSLSYLAELGGLSHIMSRLEIPQEACDSLEPLKRVEAWLSESADWGSLAVWRESMEKEWSTIIVDNRSRRTILKLAGLLARVPQSSDAMQVGRNLCLSRRECLHLQNTIAASREIALRVDLESPLGIYDYYQRYAEAGLDGAVLAMATLDLAADRQTVANALLAAWFTHYHELVDPPALLTGDDLIRELHMTAGPRVGEVLELIRRAQVQGEVTTRDEALAHVRLIARDEPPALL